MTRIFSKVSPRGNIDGTLPKARKNRGKTTNLPTTLPRIFRPRSPKTDVSFISPDKTALKAFGVPNNGPPTLRKAATLRKQHKFERTNERQVENKLFIDPIFTGVFRDPTKKKHHVVCAHRMRQKSDFFVVFFS